MPKHRQYLQTVFKLENKYAPLLFVIIKSFRLSFIEVFKEHGHDYAQQYLNTPHLNPNLLELLQKLYRESGLFGAQLTASELKEIAGGKAGGFGKNERWIAAVNNYLKVHMLRFVSNITDTQRDDILKILQRAVKDNLSINDTVTKLRDEGLMKARARVIARTEIVRAANVGHAIAAAETPYEVEKNWSAAHDFRTRHSHSDVDGKKVGEMETFKVPIYVRKKIVGYDNMQYPGDATAHPSNTINCRCRFYVTPKKDAEGNLIMRRTTATEATVIPMGSRSEYTPAQIAAALKANIRITTELGD